MAEILGIDVGGSGIKGALVDTGTGKLVSERHRLATPKPSTPKRVADTIRELVAEFDSMGPIGCCFPTVVIDGTARTASNMGEEWRGTRIDSLFADATGRPFTVLNDADAAGVAEMRLGAGRGLDGMVIMITIGTGIGSALFYNGLLVPNLELGWMPGKEGEPMEKYASDRARRENDLSWDDWAERFDYFLRSVTRVLTPDHFILGGGASKKFDQYGHHITVEPAVHIAEFLNNAGIIGAAVIAAEQHPG